MHFAVIDSDNLGGYPQNFVCILPLIRKSLAAESSYAKILKQDSISFSVKSLSKALATEKDPEIIKAINKRLTFFEMISLLNLRGKSAFFIFLI